MKMISVLNTALRVILPAALLWSTSCTDARTTDGAKPSVVAAFFPIADAAERVGGDRIDVINLTPAGAEPHDLELTTQARDDVLDADVVLYLKGFQPSLDEAVADAQGTVVDLLAGVEGRDPHIWLDPQLWKATVIRITEVLAAGPDAAPQDDRVRLPPYVHDLDRLHEAFVSGLGACRQDLIVTAHDAFSRLADRYDLGQLSIAGVSPEAEPDPQHLAELVDLVEAEGITTIFTEELVSPDVAETLAREAGVEAAVLDPIESEPRGGYVAAMRRNLRALREALDCT